jgi:SAM-dependent methyltransferase
VAVTTDPDLQRELERRVASLSRYFDTATLAEAGATLGGVRKYYQDSRVGYRLVHDPAAIHMALNPDGRFDRSGYAGQAHLVEAPLPPATKAVLELACGNGFNLRELSRRCPAIQFQGIDLVPRQVERANALLRTLPNATARLGNFHSLEFDSTSFDCVFVIESFCHALDVAKALTETRRVTRDRGRFVVIDAWRTDGYDAFPDSVRQAVRDVERGMAVHEGRQVSVWKAVATDCGWRVVDDRDLTDQIKPNLDRLARIVERRLLSHPMRARVLSKVLPASLAMNAISGYLMPLTVALGAHTYRMITLEPR